MRVQSCSLLLVFYFLKIFIFWAIDGVKGQKWPKMDKKHALTACDVIVIFGISEEINNISRLFLFINLFQKKFCFGPNRGNSAKRSKLTCNNVNNILGEV